MAEIIKVQCGGCDVKIKAPVKYQGRQVECPQCSHPVKIPRLENANAGLETQPVAPIIEDYETPMELGDDAFHEPEPKPRKRPPKDDFADFDLADVEDYGHPDDYDAPPRPRRRRNPPGGGSQKRRKKKTSTASSSSDEGGIEPSIIGGILMMVGAVVWFVVGWNMGIIFFYPPILFVCGIAAFIKGLVS